MDAFTRLAGPALVMPQENVDTDQIIPARFLTTTSFDDLAEGAFADWRWNDDGSPREDCVLNESRAAHSPILVTGRNFGCGSSREHAPRALMALGFRVVISSEIADIFRSNCQNVGLLPVVLPENDMQRLLDMDGEELAVSLEDCTVSGRGPDGSEFCCSFEIYGFARHCLLNGMDRLDFLLAEIPAIEAYEVSHER